MKRTLSERVYDLLLHLVPNDGSTRQEMREVFRDAYRDTCRDTGLDSCLDKTQGGTSILRLWPLAIIDLLRTAMAMRRPSPRALFETTFGDLRLGFRALRTSPGSSLVVILTLGLAIGVNSTIFSLGQQVMFPTLPITDIETLVFVRASNPELNRFRAGMSSADLADIRASSTTLVDVAGLARGSYTLTDADEPVRLGVGLATANIFEVFGVGPAIGRGFAPGEGEPGAADVAVLSHGVWQSRFAGDASMVGATITLDGAGYTVIGILPEVFDVGGFGAHDVWTPLKRDAVVTPRDQRDLQVFGRLAPGASVTAAKEEILALSVALQQEHPETNAGWQVSVLSFYEGAVGPNATAVFTLMSASVMFILLIACANVANLMLARAAMRRQELAVRQAMGAWRGRLVRQLITESGVLAVLSAGAGLLFAHWTLRGLVAMSGDGVTFLTQASIDTSVLVFAVGLAMATPLIFGVIPALRSTGFNLARATRAASGAGSTGRPRRLRPTSGSVLASLQVALAVVLLVVASLATRSVMALLDLELGFDAENLVTMRVDLPPTYEEGQRSVAFFDEAVVEIEASPSIERAAWTSNLPIVGGETTRSIAIEGKPAASDADIAWVSTVVVTPGYFDTLGVALARGRQLDTSDTVDARPTALVSESAMQRYWPGQDPVGGRVKLGGADADTPWIEIVGVVGDLRNPDADQPPAPYLYLPLAQNPTTNLALVARTRTDAMAATDDVRRAIWSVDADQPIDRVRSMSQVLYDDFAGDISAISLMVFFSMVALALATAGVYAVISFTVTRRYREIGIRMALGARQSSVVAMVLRQGVAPVIAGLTLGLTGGFVIAQLIAGTLFGVGPRDPVTFLGVPGLLFVVGVIASLVPALRATRVDPLEAVRAE